MINVDIRYFNYFSFFREDFYAYEAWLSGYLFLRLKVSLHQREWVLIDSSLRPALFPITRCILIILSVTDLKGAHPRADTLLAVNRLRLTCYWEFHTQNDFLLFVFIVRVLSMMIPTVCSEQKHSHVGTSARVQAGINVFNIKASLLEWKAEKLACCDAYALRLYKF